MSIWHNTPCRDLIRFCRVIHITLALGKNLVFYLHTQRENTILYCRRRIHIQNSGQSRNVSSDTQNQRERETTVPNTATQHFHRNLVHTVSEAFIDAFNSAQLVRMQIPDTTNRTNANTTAQNSTASQTTSRPPFPIPPLPFMQNMVC